MLKENTYTFENVSAFYPAYTMSRSLYLDEKIVSGEGNHPVSEFTVVDLDGDGVSEVVCERYDGHDYIILRYEDGYVMGYHMSYRAFRAVKQDGSFMGYGNATTSETDCRIQFKENSQTAKPLR